METNKLKKAFVESFWKWFEEYHKERYAKEGRPDLYPVRKYHEKFMNFESPQWDWVAQFVRECFVPKPSSSTENIPGGRNEK